MSRSKILEQQNYLVVKGNDMIQRSRYSLSLTEQRIIIFLISKIKPDDNFLQPYEFTVREFCNVCGLDEYQGFYYSYIKNTIKKLRDKSFWVRTGDGKETLFAWLDTATVDEVSGTISVRLSYSITPYLLGLKEKFTSYELTNILAMRKSYSVRLYELLKSYSRLNSKGFTVNELRQRLDAENYAEFYDLKRRVLEPAVKEINDYSDLAVEYEVIAVKRKVSHVHFFIREKSDEERRSSIARRRKRVDRHTKNHPEEQMLLGDWLESISINRSE